MKSTLETPPSEDNNRPFVVEGQVSIDHFTTSPEGFQVVGRGVTRAVFLENRLRPNPTPEDLLGYLHDLRGEEDFQHKLAERSGVPTFRAARDARHLASESGSATPEELAHLKHEEEERWRESRGKSDKLNFHSPRIEDNTIYFDEMTTTTFPSYKRFAKPGQSPEIIDVSKASAVCMAVTTADNRLILQHRAVTKQHMLRDGGVKGNALYADIPGVSVGGMFDATVNPETPGAPKDITTEDVLQAALKEAWEEIDLNPEDLDTRIVAVADDKLQRHTEFLLQATTTLTAPQMYERSRQSRRNKNLGPHDFAEKYIDIEASPEAIFTLLTEVRCPLPNTHAAAIVAAGYLKMLESEGQQAANDWRNELEIKMNENYAAIDQTVADYYEKFPEAADQVPERYWGKSVPKRNPSGYSPDFTPRDQGLPELQDELVRTGLVPETREVVSELHLFDVDGVLTDPIERRVTEPKLLSEIIRRLTDGEPVALNSGRSTEWVLENVVTPLSEELGSDRSLLEKLCVIGEKGNTWATFNGEGELHKGKKEGLHIDEELKTTLDQLVANTPRYRDVIADDEPKETMLSFVMKPGVDLKHFETVRKEFAQDVQRILVELGKDQDIEVDETTIAADVQNANAGKALGTDRFLAILKEMNIKYNEARFTAYGDSISDRAMAEELSRRGLQGTFVFVGNAELSDPKHHDQQNVGGYTQGTLQVLQNS